MKSINSFEDKKAAQRAARSMADQPRGSIGGFAR
jgi:hypothetical protein